jgi:threonylcarbamoyladenosine tRNA methylthiotransferase MtaB
LTALSNLKDFAPQFHLSLQSGSDGVLKKMNRHYTKKEYFDKVCLIRKYFPKAGITTDIIVGFPTETDEEFNESFDFVKSVKFADIHPFPYSKRGGTVASKLTEVEKSIVRTRLEKMLELKQNCKDNFLKLNLGDTLTVLTEEVDGDLITGYAENYLRVYLDASKVKSGEFVKVKITGAHKDGALGEIIN